MKSPRLLTIVSIPLALNIVLYVLFFKYGAQFIDHYITTLTASFSGWTATASYWALKIAGWLVLAITAAISFSVISGILASPFNDWLSRATAQICARHHSAVAFLPQAQHDLSFKNVIILELKRTLVLVVVGLTAFVLGLIPFLQIPALVLGAWVLAFEYFGYPLSQRSPKLYTVVLFTLRYPFASLGFGLCLLMLTLIPFGSIVYIPLAVTGGTLLHFELTRPRS